MEVLNPNAETGCCKRFNPEPWQDKEIQFKDRLFLKDSTFSLFGIPLGFGKLMVRNMEIVKNAGAIVEAPLMLSDCSSPWRTDVYIEISKEIPGQNMQRITGNFLTKVFEGSYSNIGKWIKEMKSHVQSKGKGMKKLYLFYTTCPSCARAYGMNYTVIFAEI